MSDVKDLLSECIVNSYSPSIIAVSLFYPRHPVGRFDTFKAATFSNRKGKYRNTLHICWSFIHSRFNLFRKLLWRKDAREKRYCLMAGILPGMLLRHRRWRGKRPRKFWSRWWLAALPRIWWWPFLWRNWHESDANERDWKWLRLANAGTSITNRDHAAIPELHANEVDE